MDFKKIYTLKQHTPIIHFQYAQSGATLRATEVKPKLDDFILKKVGKETAKREGWLIGETDALDYKMRFRSPGEEPVPLTKEYDIYYGNMGDDAIYVEGIFAKDRKVTMEIICFQRTLRETIDSVLENFFNVTNFGRMQNKGFGSFTLEPEVALSSRTQHIRVAQQLCEQYGATHCYYFPAGNQCFKRIKTVYSIIKSGVNFGGYRRSLLFYYMHDMSIGNEKAWLKQNGMAPTDVGNHANSGNYKKYRVSTQSHTPLYVRALLGVGDHVEYKRNGTKNLSISINCIEKDQKDKPLIERFPSPIFFKVVGGNVYYVGGRIGAHTRKNDKKPTEIWGREFAFQSGTTVRTLKTPAKNSKPCFNENFMDGFLAYCFNELNNPNPRGGQETPLSDCLGTKNMKVNLKIEKYERKGGNNQ